MPALFNGSNSYRHVRRKVDQGKALPSARIRTSSAAEPASKGDSMSVFTPWVKNFARATAIAFAAVALGGCVSGVYVDTTIKDVPAAERVTVANPQPVQLFYEFQTKGARNSQATDLTRNMLLKAVKDSGLFANVTTEPVPNGAMLNITVNNVILDADFAKAFMTGFTFGLVGTTSGDGYICTIDYVAGPNSQKLESVTRDAIYASFGTNGQPPNTQKVKDFNAAVELMIHKVVGNGLNSLAKDANFPK